MPLGSYSRPDCEVNERLDMHPVPTVPTVPRPSQCGTPPPPATASPAISLPAESGFFKTPKVEEILVATLIPKEERALPVQEHRGLSVRRGPRGISAGFTSESPGVLRTQKPISGE